MTVNEQAEARADGSPDADVAVLGTGALGSAIARRLCEQGHRVRVWNRTRERAEPLAEFGAIVADSPVDAARGCRFLLTVLSNGPVVADQVADALDVLAEGAVWIQLATVGIEPLAELRRLADEHGVRLLDSPVSGSPDDAAQGRLAVLASGADDALDAAAPLLQDLGRSVLRVGPLGAGTSLKLVVNGWLNALLEATAEAVAFAEARSLDGALLCDALAGGPLDSPWLQHVGRAMAASDFGSGGSLELVLKDVRLARDVIEEQGLDLPLSALVSGRISRAVALGAEVQQELVLASRAGTPAPRDPGAEIDADPKR